MANWNILFSDLVGFVGVSFLLVAYAGVQFERLAADGIWYSCLNAIAALLIGFSLIYSFNAASMVIEVFWFVISLFGLIKAIRRQAR